MLNEILLLAVALPAFVSILVAAIIASLPGNSAERLVGPLSLFAGFAAAWTALEWLSWIPTTAAWHWTPYAVAFAAVVAPISFTTGATWIERLLLWCTAMVIVAWFVVPSWPDLQPTRRVAIAIVVASAVAGAALVLPLASRMSTVTLARGLAVAAVGGAVVQGLLGSAKFAEIGLALASAMTGSIMAARTERFRFDLRPLILMFYFVLPGFLYFRSLSTSSDGSDDAATHWICCGLVVASPVALWVTRLPRLRDATGWRRLLFLVAVLIPVGMAIGLAVAAG